MPEITIGDFLDAGRRGGDIRLNSGGGKQQLITGNRVTLFGRMVGWLRENVFNSPSTRDTHVQQRVAAGKKFFDVVREKHGVAGERAAREVVTRPFIEKVPLSKLVDRAAREADQAGRTAARNANAAARFLSDIESFKKAGELAGIDIRKLSAGQLKLAEALVLLEAKATGDQNLEKVVNIIAGRKQTRLEEMVGTAVAAAEAAPRELEAKLANLILTFGTADDFGRADDARDEAQQAAADQVRLGLDGALPLDRHVTFEEAMERLAEKHPAGHPTGLWAFLTASNRMPHLRTVVQKNPAFHELAQKTVRRAKEGKLVPADAFSRSPRDRDFFSSPWRKDLRLPITGEETARWLNSRLEKPKAVSSVKVAQKTYEVATPFTGDWRRMPWQIPVKQTVVADQPYRDSVVDGIQDLTRRSPAIERTIKALIRASEKGEKKSQLDTFVSGLLEMERGEDPLTITLPPGDGSEKHGKDGPLTLTGWRNEAGDIEIEAAMVANLAISRNGKEAVKEVALFAGDEKVLAATNLMSQTITNYMDTHIANSADLRTGTDPDDLPIIPAAADTRHLSLARAEGGDWILNVHYRSTIEQMRSFGPQPTLRLDPTDSFKEYEVRFNIPERAIEANGKVRMELSAPVIASVGLSVDFAAAVMEGSRAGRTRMGRADRAGDQKGADEAAQRRRDDAIRNSNRFMLSLYRPGGLKAHEAWKAAGVSSQKFNHRQKARIFTLMHEGVGSAGFLEDPQFSAEEMLKIARNSIRIVMHEEKIEIEEEEEEEEEEVSDETGIYSRGFDDEFWGSESDDEKAELSFKKGVDARNM